MIVALGLTSTGLTTSAQAALGGAPMTPPPSDTAANVRTIQKNISGAAIRAGRERTNGAASLPAGAATYTVRETTLGSRTIIREYLAMGKVFGVAWQGPAPPNLADLLGSYFPQYAQGVKAMHAAHGTRTPVLIDTSTLSIRIGGHMGALFGRAWLPQALPAGLSGNDIQ